MVGLVTARTLRLTIEYKLEIILKLRPHGQAVKTPPFHGGIPGSNPGGVTKSLLAFLAKCEFYGSIAQLGEHLPYKQGVTGSSPVTSTNIIMGCFNPCIWPGSSAG